MAKYIVNRLFGMAAVLLMVATIVFVIVRIAPGDPAAVMLGPDAPPEVIEALRVRLGLERPLIAQYVAFLGEVVRGDLGQSIFFNLPVTDLLLDRAEPTLILTLMAFAVAVVIAVPVGILAAYRRGSFVDQAATLLAMLAASVPSFWLAIVLIQIFAVGWGVLPVSGYGAPDAGLAERVRHLVLPAMALGAVSSSLILRFTRASMLDVLGDDYIRTARAKGVAEWRIVLRHALKNALIPILTVLGMTLAALISGAVVTETVFGLPGLGNLVVTAVSRRDYPVIQGALLIIAALYVLINFAIDMLYLVVDPRVRY